MPLGTPLFNIGDGVIFYGDQATVEEIDHRKNSRPDYFIRFVSDSTHTWANELELEPVELNYDVR
jgi:hypothetical protein